MQSYKDIMGLDIKHHELKMLKYQVRQIYERRIKMRLITAEQMSGCEDLSAIELRYLKDLKTEVRQIYSRRMRLRLL